MLHSNLSNGFSCWMVMGLLVFVNLPGASVSADEDPNRILDEINAFIANRAGESESDVAPRCTDREFARRLYLDLAGRLPTPPEVARFLAADEGRRDQLIDELLERPEWPERFASSFDTMLMGRGDGRDYRERKQFGWNKYLADVIRKDRPWHEVVQEVLLARPNSPEASGAVWFLYERRDDHQKIAEAVSRAFFGVRIDCIQCHDHMSAYELEQRHYWGLVAFFNRGSNKKTPSGPRIAESAVGGFSEFANLEGSSTPNYLTFIERPTVPEDRPEPGQEQPDPAEAYQDALVPEGPRIPVFSRREAFVREVVADHPRIAQAFVNRMWGLLLGRGIVHPVDEMDSDHPPSHPELLELLAKDFRSSNYNIDRLVRLIVRSDAYQRSSRKPSGATDPATFAWYPPRPLIAEQLTRSIHQVVLQSADLQMPLRDDLRSVMPDVLPENVQTDIGDVLYLSNNAGLHELLAEDSDGRHIVSRLSALNDDQQVLGVLFEEAFSRSPDTAEMARLVEYLSGRPGSDRRERIRQVVWALLTSAEFRMNH